MTVDSGSVVRGSLIALACLLASMAAEAFDWIAPTSAELAMTAEPKAPGAPAIYLYRQVDRDDDGPSERVYLRVKILTEEGRSHADVEIPFEKSTESVEGIVARTIRPNGTIVNFDGSIYEKTVSETRGAKWMRKTFTLPDVQVGSIIEYSYRHNFARGYVFNSQWILSEDLFTRYGKFSLTPYRGYPMSFAWPHGLPPGTDPPRYTHELVRLETHDVAAFLVEEHMPPANELMYLVNFTYITDGNTERDPPTFWKKFGEKKYASTEKFLDRSRSMADAVADIVGPDDSADVKVQKIYARVQQLRNLSYARRRGEQEADRESLKTPEDVRDVWKHGYGYSDELNLLFIALARAAGVEADLLLVPSRYDHFFTYTVMNPRELDSNMAAVTLDGATHYLDPGMPFAPYGVLPWMQTAVKALRLDKHGGVWVNTPLPPPAESRIERRAALELLPNGTLEGKVTVTYSGQEALWRRLQEGHEDDADRRQFLEDQLQQDVPSGIVAELVNQPDWDGSAATLVAQYDLKIPGWATTAGSRTLLPAGLFGARDKNSFVHANRVQMVYFEFPYQTLDDISIRMPPTWMAGSLPKPRRVDKQSLVYDASAEARDGVLHFQRSLSLNLTLVSTRFYGPLQEFFQDVRNGDEDRVTLSRTTPPPTPAVVANH